MRLRPGEAHVQKNLAKPQVLSRDGGLKIDPDGLEER
jgi:hypothetical protein